MEETSRRWLTSPRDWMSEHADPQSYTCEWLIDSMTIHSDGNVTCGLDDPNARRSFGNIRNSDLSEIAANPAYASAISSLGQGHHCLDCGHPPPDRRPSLSASPGATSCRPAWKAAHGLTAASKPRRPTAPPASASRSSRRPTGSARSRWGRRTCAASASSSRPHGKAPSRPTRTPPTTQPHSAARTRPARRSSGTPACHADPARQAETRVEPAGAPDAPTKGEAFARATPYRRAFSNQP